MNKSLLIQALKAVALAQTPVQAPVTQPKPAPQPQPVQRFAWDGPTYMDDGYSC